MYFHITQIWFIIRSIQLFCVLYDLSFVHDNGILSFKVVREERGPYSDPQHPYFYEDEDVWMAPGFINQFYEVSYNQLFMTGEIVLHQV